ncbi:hypothetical protein A3A76_06035 [Candidatus Woesebacteria bacterium RIFCSPLOWO2_01_FULL_39_23]|uniref:KANL3/Tex30 alpha/beta hydrolase-like domain-containing protein n=1 Tax=Candidatus Woesebacteria bacterium RIFCSPHIGHO2_01_FULL_40_22 TaxID=1802499 RepID=A0A1F7YHY8_9BACT|nr:MAG: hypothetical protein A2141_02730 [Candidatus Woesebacteria bacterium RBG_16_40_11]OGM26961.1 MAG: hypothetical protein A2628_05975 [Candidatus Woesebacteria bacterium RIFCSPHIGHO2_01_FULL_40_22]OGM37368.1 MAG: hypothetical protein A3E41_04380 [Candidatus Woesebacteria bacterium RIFCSPHIGHO2_12_FULL_38_9]OGM63236.1 MAG: hypothetical protein A3A76_06035 [Candidatus Woesebacteria bacterium RIFCSPLOWO2_01_FULL_39_23]
MNNLPNFRFFHNKNADTLDIVLNGADYDMDSDFMVKIFEISKKAGKSVVTFNFPFQDRGEESSSGETMPEETEALKSVMNFCHSKDYKNIRFIGKSLGAILATLFLNNIKDVEKYSLIILGTPLKYFPKISFTGNIYVIQGENDKNGGVKEVKEAFNNLDQNKIKYFEIPGADHSFRDPETKDPIFQEKALEILSTIKKILQNRKSAN